MDRKICAYTQTTNATNSVCVCACVLVYIYYVYIHTNLYISPCARHVQVPQFESQKTPEAKVCPNAALTRGAPAQSAEV